MTDKKFTDEEIIHHLDCYENLGYRWCGYAINLINRQKADIERLQKYNTDVAFKHYNDGKAEGAREIFEEIERLLDKHIAKANYTDGTFTLVFKRTLEVDIAELKKKYQEGE